MVFFRDRRGVAAMEGALIFPLLIALLLPISDLGAAALQYMAAYQNMRNLGAYAQYHLPPDVTNLAGWTLPSVPGSTITSKVMCGETTTACSAANLASPKWMAFSTNIVINPMFLTAIGGTYTVNYSERFQ
jgi:hypothetical protein